MSLIDKIDRGSGFEASNVAYSNTTGTPVVSADDAESGELIAGTYTLVLSAVGGGTATVTVSADSPNNPYDGKVVTGVALDDLTARRDVVPGVDIVFSSGSANADEAEVIVGVYEGSFDATGVGAGTPSAGTRHQVENDGTGAVIEAMARLITQSVMYQKTGKALHAIKPFAENATEKTAGGGSTRVIPYALKVVNVSGVGAAKVADLQMDGVTFGADTITDLEDGASVDGTGLEAISPLHWYRVNTGALEGLEFAISPDCAEDDVSNVLIFNSRFLQIAEDVAGVAGTYGTTDVDLTESGEPTGVIQPSGLAYYWVRVLVPYGSGAESNPYPMKVALQAKETGQANWGG